MSSSGDGVTMRDVAQAAGVHMSTVSRVLRGDTARVSAATATRVRSIAASLDFHPHPGAASLRSGSARLIGVLVPRITDVVLAATFEAIEEAAMSHGYQAVVASTHDDAIQRRRRVSLFRSRRVDGLIIADARLRTPYLGELHRAGVPFVLVSRRCGRWPSITGDDVAGGAQVAAHLAEQGHRSIAVIGGPGYASTAVDRVRGFRDELGRRGIEIPDELVVNTSFDAEGGRLGMHKILDLTLPSAIFAVNDYAAIGAVGAIGDRGARPGRDIAVVGYNDISIAAQLSLRLSSVRSRADEAGRRAVEGLLELITTGRTESHRLASELIVRESSARQVESDRVLAPREAVGTPQPVRHVRHVVS